MSDGSAVRAGRERPSRGRIDVHAHYVPPALREALVAAGQEHPDGFPASLPHWSPAGAVEAMDRLEIAVGILSVTSPGVYLTDDAGAARELARAVNEAAAAAVAAYPDRFGFLASLPLPDVEAGLAELEHALDVLHADGVTLLTCNRGVYLGDERLEPIFAELGRRRAVVALHPTAPPGSENAVPTGYGGPLLEFMFDTTRAVANLILTGTLERHPEIRLIVPHAGAALPVLADRVEGLAGLFPAPGRSSPPEVIEPLRRLHYDLAGFPVPRLLTALLQLVGTDRLMYGSDWPLSPESLVERLARDLETTPLLDEAQRGAVDRLNALALFPRLAEPDAQPDRAR